MSMKRRSMRPLADEASAEAELEDLGTLKLPFTTNEGHTFVSYTRLRIINVMELFCD